MLKAILRCARVGFYVFIGVVAVLFTTAGIGSIGTAFAGADMSNQQCWNVGGMEGCLTGYAGTLEWSLTGGSTGYNSQEIQFTNGEGVGGTWDTGPCYSSTYNVSLREVNNVPIGGTIFSGTVTFPDVGLGGTTVQFSGISTDVSTPAPADNCTPMPPAPTGSIGNDVVGMAATADGDGYLLVDNHGSVQASGDATYAGSLPSLGENVSDIVGITPTRDNQGYWLDATDGGIFAFGDAQFYGSTGSIRLNKPMVGMAAAPDGRGYWEVAADGGIFAFGDAQFYGSMGGKPLNQPVVGIAADYATGGYWMVASDGGIFSFNAQFFGSTGSIRLNQPIIEMEAAPSGQGYRFVAKDGGVFSFNLPYEGSLPGEGRSVSDVAGMAASGDNGYWVVERNTTVYAFGNAPVLVI